MERGIVSGSDHLFAFSPGTIKRQKCMEKGAGKANRSRVIRLLVCVPTVSISNCTGMFRAVANGLMCDGDPCRVDPKMRLWELTRVAELESRVAEVIASGST